MGKFTARDKKSILFIETGKGFGGAVTCLYALLRGLNRKKYIPIVISSHNDEATKKLMEEIEVNFFYVRKYKRRGSINNLIGKVAKQGMSIKRIGLILIFLIEVIRKIPFFIKVLRIVKRNNIGIIYLNNNIDCNIEGIIIAKLLKIPCVCHVRASEYNSFEARFVARYVNCFIAMSKFVKESLLNLGIPQEKVKVIYDGIDMNQVEEKKKNFQTDELNRYPLGKYNIGLFACLMWWKGHKVFIKTADILVKKMNLKECKFFIVGDIPDKKLKLKEELMDLVNRLTLSDYITFTGHQSNVYQFMNKMDIIVHTSTEPEPFGRVIIEAMALGKPIIATKMGGPLEIIEDGANGILIPANDPYILADTIFNLLKDNNGLKQISQEAEKTVRERFSLGNCIRDIEEIYEEIIQ